MSSRRPSIAWRLAIGLTSLMALLWVGAAAIGALVMQNELNAAFDDSLRQSALRLLPLALHRLHEPEEAEEFDIPGLDDDNSYVTYFIKRFDGDLVVRSGGVPDALTSVDVPNGFSVASGERVFALTDPRSQYRIVVLEDLDHRTKALWDSLAALTLPLAALIPVIAIGIWFAIRTAMRPVESLSREIAMRDRRNLSPLGDDGQPVELAPIAAAVADLLKRLQAALDAERAFAASSAHELRTPIAGALAQTQQLALELGTATGHERVREIETALRHLAQLSEKLLQLARLDAGFAQSAVVVDLVPVIRLVVRDFAGRGTEDPDIELVLDHGADLRAPIDADAFAIALRNLIENARLHGAAGQSIAIHGRSDRTVHVVNAGPVIPPETLARIGEPFVRGTTSASGTGLGLSIVRSIMEQAGGRLQLVSPATGRSDGFEAILTLP